MSIIKPRSRPIGSSTNEGGNRNVNGGGKKAPFELSPPILFSAYQPEKHVNLHRSLDSSASAMRKRFSGDGDSLYEKTPDLPGHHRRSRSAHSRSLGYSLNAETPSSENIDGINKGTGEARDEQLKYAIGVVVRALDEGVPLDQAEMFLSCQHFDEDMIRQAVGCALHLANNTDRVGRTRSRPMQRGKKWSYKQLVSMFEEQISGMPPSATETSRRGRARSRPRKSERDRAMNRPHSIGPSRVRRAFEEAAAFSTPYHAALPTPISSNATLPDHSYGEVVTPANTEDFTVNSWKSSQRRASRELYFEEDEKQPSTDASSNAENQPPQPRTNRAHGIVRSRPPAPQRSASSQTNRSPVSTRQSQNKRRGTREGRAILDHVLSARSAKSARSPTHSSRHSHPASSASSTSTSTTTATQDKSDPSNSTSTLSDPPKPAPSSARRAKTRKPSRKIAEGMKLFTQKHPKQIKKVSSLAALRRKKRPKTRTLKFKNKIPRSKSPQPTKKRKKRALGSERSR